MGRKQNDQSKPCVTCGESKRIHAKGMCSSCTAKKYRSTEGGKIAMAKYNATKGKEARERYYKKNGIIRTPRPVKKDCGCGSPSSVKGLCRKCYYKSYYRKTEYPESGIDINAIFNDVIGYMELGLPIYKSVKKSGLKEPATFYRLISVEQKAKLDAYRELKRIIKKEFKTYGR